MCRPSQAFRRFNEAPGAMTGQTCGRIGRAELARRVRIAPPAFIGSSAFITRRGSNRSRRHWRCSGVDWSSRVESKIGALRPILIAHFRYGMYGYFSRPGRPRPCWTVTGPSRKRFAGVSNFYSDQICLVIRQADCGRDPRRQALRGI